MFIQGPADHGADDLLPDQGDRPVDTSVADLAVAIVDAIETPKHVQKRFATRNQKGGPQGVWFW